MRRIKSIVAVSFLGLAFLVAPAFAKTSNQIAYKPDLTVTSITFSTNFTNQTGTVLVIVKNVGNKALYSGAGLTNTYFNLPLQSPDWQYDAQTPGPGSYLTTRPMPTAAYPLLPGESIGFLWLGKFVQPGNYYLDYIVDNGNELDELNENNNRLSAAIAVVNPGNQYFNFTE